MPFLENPQAFESPFWLPEKHTQSIFPALFRKVDLKSPTRERFVLSDGDFVDLDWYVKGKIGDRSMLIISHGLEGSSSRHYVTGLAKKAIRAGMDVLAWNYRSCSGEMNLNKRFYHSGATNDLNEVVDYAIQKGVRELDMAGFSLGGNLTLKWLGEKAEKPPKGLRKAVVFSVPLHLSSSSQTLARLENWIYTKRFLSSLVEKVQKKVELFPELAHQLKLSKIETLWDFDEYVTGPLHGFAGAEDYYEKNSSIYFLPSIKVPVLIVNAANDPFLSEQCFPIDLVNSLENVFLEIPNEGGHCGFYPNDYEGFLWSETRAIQWLRDV